MTSFNERFSKWFQEHRNRLREESKTIKNTSKMSEVKNNNTSIITKVFKTYSRRNCVKKRQVEMLLNECIMPTSAKVSAVHLKDKLQNLAKPSTKHNEVCIGRTKYTNINVKRQKFTLSNIVVNLITPYSDYLDNACSKGDTVNNYNYKVSNLFSRMFDKSKLINLRNYLIKNDIVVLDFNILLLSETWLNSKQLIEPNYDCIVQFKDCYDKNKKIVTVNHNEDSQKIIISPHTNISFKCVYQINTSSSEVGEISISESTVNNEKIIVVIVYIYKNQTANSIKNFLLHSLLPYTIKGAEIFATESAEHDYCKIPMVLSGHFNADLTSTDYLPLFEFLRNDLSLTMTYQFLNPSVKQGLTIECAIFVRSSNLFKSKISILYLNRYHLQILETDLNRNNNHLFNEMKVQLIKIKKHDRNNDIMYIQTETILNQSEQLDKKIRHFNTSDSVVIESKIKTEPKEFEQCNTYQGTAEKEIKTESEEIDQFNIDKYYSNIESEIKIEPETIT